MAAGIFKAFAWCESGRESRIRFDFMWIFPCRWPALACRGPDQGTERLGVWPFYATL